MDPEVSVVVPTHNRPAGLASLIRALESQTLAPDRFEVIVVDDGSDVPQSIAPGPLSLRFIRHDRPRGPAAARNSGWRSAESTLVAFIDDDCRPVPGWLEAIVGSAREGNGALIVQGPVEPAPEQYAELTPLSHTIEVAGPSRLFVSANIAYSKALLERIGGFDETFKIACGEDVELGARATKAGAETRYARDALVHHDVRRLGLRDLVRHTFKWTDSVRALSMHPELRDLLVAHVFWKRTHPLLLLAVAGLLSRRPVLAGAALVPYLAHYYGVYDNRPRRLIRALPVHVAVDICEIGTAVTGSLRYRTLMI